MRWIPGGQFDLRGPCLERRGVVVGGPLLDGLNGVTPAALRPRRLADFAYRSAMDAVGEVDRTSARAARREDRMPW
jgi:hypothetical protein